MKFLLLLSLLTLTLGLAGCASMTKTSVIDQTFDADTDDVWTEALNYLHNHRLFIAKLVPQEHHLEVHQTVATKPAPYETRFFHNYAECPYVQSMIPIQDKIDLELDVTIEDDGLTHLILRPVFTRIYIDKQSDLTNLFVSEECRSLGTLEDSLLDYVANHLPVKAEVLANGSLAVSRH